MSSHAFAFTAALVLTVPAWARAQEETSTPSPTALEVDGALGWTDGEQAGGVTFSGTGRLRYHVLTVGLGLQAATVLFVNMASVSSVAGLTIPVGPLRVDALGELGIDAYEGVHRGWLNGNPGTSGAMPFAGARASLLVRLRRHPRGHEAWIGLTGSYADDLERRTKTYSWRDSGENWLTGESYDEPRTSTVVLGQERYALLATVSVTYAL